MEDGRVARGLLLRSAARESLWCVVVREVAEDTCVWYRELNVPAGMHIMHFIPYVVS